MQPQELFTVKNRTSMSECATYGSALKIYENSCKGFVLSLASTAGLSLPRAARNTLAVSYNYIVFQIYLPSGRSFTLELKFTDNTGLRRRLVFMNTQEISLDTLHAKIPNGMFIRDKWVNLCIDMQGNTQKCFSGIQYRILDHIRITGSCKVRKIYVRKNCLKVTQNLSGVFEFPVGVEYTNQVIGGSLALPKVNSVMQCSLPLIKIDKNFRDSSIFIDTDTPVKPREIKSLMASPDRSYLKMNDHYDKIIRNHLGPTNYQKCKIYLDMLEKSMFQDSTPNKLILPSLDINSPKILINTSSSSLLKPDEEEIEEIIEYQDDKLKDFRQSRIDISIIELMTRYNLDLSKEVLPNYYTDRIAKIMQVRHFTPPFVNISYDNEALIRYDPISKHYE